MDKGVSLAEESLGLRFCRYAVVVTNIYVGCPIGRFDTVLDDLFLGFVQQGQKSSLVCELCVLERLFGGIQRETRG